MLFVLHLFLHLSIDLNLFQFLSPNLLFIYCSYLFFSSDLSSGRLHISIELLLPDPNAYSVCALNYINKKTKNKKKSSSIRQLPQLHNLPIGKCTPSNYYYLSA